MATTLRAESLADSNIKERSQLNAAADTVATTLTLRSTDGFAQDMPIVVGQGGQDGAELAVVASVSSATQVALTAPLTLPHSVYEPVTGLLGRKLRIYRAPNVDGSVPADEAFSVLASRTLDVDQPSTYYIDSEGSSSYWYKLTYFNDVTQDETSLAEATAFRGDDFGHYASLSDIRSKAGFDNASNLSDDRIDLERRAAEDEINTALKGYYTVPFSKPVPKQITSLTIQLAAGLLLLAVYGAGYAQGKELTKSARDQLQALRGGGGTLADSSEVTGSNDISFYPDDTVDDDRAFESVLERF